MAATPSPVSYTPLSYANNERESWCLLSPAELTLKDTPASARKRYLGRVEQASIVISGIRAMYDAEVRTHNEKMAEANAAKAKRIEQFPDCKALAASIEKEEIDGLLAKFEGSHGLRCRDIAIARNELFADLDRFAVICLIDPVTTVLDLLLWMAGKDYGKKDSLPGVDARIRMYDFGSELVDRLLVSSSTGLHGRVRQVVKMLCQAGNQTAILLLCLCTTSWDIRDLDVSTCVCGHIAGITNHIRNALMAETDY